MTIRVPLANNSNYFVEAIRLHHVANGRSGRSSRVDLLWPDCEAFHRPQLNSPCFSVTLPPPFTTYTSENNHPRLRVK